MNSSAFALLLLLLIVALCGSNAVSAAAPAFDRPSENVTVIIGSSATLPCFISNLGDHKVAWIKVGNTDIIAIGDYKVTNDDRIKLVHGYVSDWSLAIQQVNEEDAGEYICQVNTEPVSISRIFLQVLLPPKIVEEKSTINPEPVVEHDTLKLYCHADGIPAPKVSWYFRKRATASLAQHQHASAASADGHAGQSTRQIHSSGAHHHHALLTPGDHVIHEGSTFVVRNVSRHHSGIYECIANNSVQPAASRKIKVSVEFPPEIHVQSEKVEQLLGLDARFECRIKANPLVNHYWMRNGNVIENNLAPYEVTGGDGAAAAQARHHHHHVRHSHSVRQSGGKYEVIIYNQNSNEFLTVNVLVVKNISKSDFGVYQCFAANALNTTKAEVELKEIAVRRAPATKPSVSKILFYSNSHKDNGGTPAINDNSLLGGEDYRHATTRLTVALSKQSRRNQTKLLGHLVGNELSKNGGVGDEESLDSNESLLYSNRASKPAAGCFALAASVALFLLISI